MAKRKTKVGRDSLSHKIGIMLYDIGFQAEYLVYRCARGLRTLMRNLLFLWQWTLSNIRTHIKPFFVTVGQDIVAPWGQFLTGVRNIKIYVAQQRAQGEEHATLRGMAYFFRGLRTYRGLFRRGVAYLLPLGALCVFTVTVSSVLSSTFALRVEYNGETLGFIADESVYEQAQMYVRDRIKGEQTGTWSLTPDMFIVPVNSAALMSKTELADKIVMANGSEIVEGVGVVVDDMLVGATENTLIINDVFDQIKTQANDGSNPDLRVEFVRNVELVYGYYLQETVISAQALIDMLSGNTPYTNDAGDKEQNNLLTLKQVLRVTYQEEIPYVVQEVEDPSLAWGVEVTTQKGTAGSKEVTQEISYIDNVEVGRVTLQETVLVPQVDEIITRGVLSEHGVVGESGTGSLIWPVPAYTYVSRGFSSYHRGLDIVAKMGTPIYASDNGVVQFAGEDLSYTNYNWTYGNYVELDHGNGTTTLYAHMVSVRDGLAEGDYVKQGELIGYVGSTGVSTGAHLHYEIWHNRVLCDPYTEVTAPSKK